MIENLEEYMKKMIKNIEEYMKKMIKNIEEYMKKMIKNIEKRLTILWRVPMVVLKLIMVKLHPTRPPISLRHENGTLHIILSQKSKNAIISLEQ